jgi:aminoglycoside 3-N-acetyltransferase
MSLGDIVNRTTRPATVESLATELGRLGVRPGETLLVHSSLSALGWVCGGAEAVLEALCRAVGRRGTLVMPTQTCDNTNPALWCNPPVPEDWWQLIAAATPAYDPARSPSRGMGQVPELFRTWPGVRRSGHPQHSFAARGRLARHITARHPLDASLGEASPLGALYRADARILLLGAPWDSCTALHLAEYRSDWPGRAWADEFAAVRPRGGGRRWVRFRLLQTDTGDFARLGTDFEAACAGGHLDGGDRPAMVRGTVALAECRLIGMRPLVDFAVDWLAAHRGLEEGLA